MGIASWINNKKTRWGCEKESFIKKQKILVYRWRKAQRHKNFTLGRYWSYTQICVEYWTRRQPHVTKC